MLTDHKPVEEEALITALVNTGKFTEDEADEMIKSCTWYYLYMKLGNGSTRTHG